MALVGAIAPKGRALPLPSRLLVHHARATLGPAKAVGDRPAVGFDVKQLDQISYDERVYQRFEFVAIAPPPEGLSYQWDFGDGATAEGRRVRHVFVDGEALPRVELRLMRGARMVGRAASGVRPVTLDGYHGIDHAELVADYARTAAAVTWTRTAGPQRVRALYDLAATTERPRLMAPLAEVFLAHWPGERGETVDAMRYTLASYLADEDAERAAALFGQLARTASDAWLAARAAAEQADLLIFQLDRPDEAEQRLRVHMRGRSPRELALLKARRGDIARRQGNLEQARETYEQARDIRRRELAARQAAVLERAHRETALAYLKQQRYPALRDVLFQWEADFPMAKLGGDLPLITARYYQAIGDHARAATELQALLGLNPLHPSRPEIAYRLGLSLAQLGRDREARQWLDDLVEKYPKSPFADDARRRLR